MLDNVRKNFAEINLNLFDELCNKKILEKEKFLYLVKKEDGDEFKSFKFVETVISNFLVIFLTSIMAPSEDLLSVSKPYHIV